MPSLSPSTVPPSPVATALPPTGAFSWLPSAPTLAAAPPSCRLLFYLPVAASSSTLVVLQGSFPSPPLIPPVPPPSVGCKYLVKCIYVLCNIVDDAPLKDFLWFFFYFLLLCSLITSWYIFNWKFSFLLIAGKWWSMFSFLVIDKNM